MSNENHKFPSQKNLENLFNYYKDKRYKEAEKLAISITKRFPKHPFSWKVLGEIFRLKNKLSDSLKATQTSIEVNSQDHEAHNNLGITLKLLGKLEDAKISFQKAIELKSDLDNSYYHLGKIFFFNKDYKKATENFFLSNHKKSKIEILKCKFEENDKNGFYKQLDYLIKKNEVNAIIGSLICRAKNKYGISRKNPFCKFPLEYLYKTNLIERYNFKNTFVKTIKNILDTSNISYKSQNLLINGVQTSGNIMANNDDFIKEIKKIILLEVENYRAYFKDSEEGFIKNWPASYDISAWIISMKNGGRLRPHIHDSGWLSGSIYINVPPKLDANSGNLVICLDDEKDDAMSNKNKVSSYNLISKFLNYIKLRMAGLSSADVQKKNLSPKKENKKKIINVVTGNLCLFPSSLFHYTIPFESKEKRVVLAFDINPK